MNPPRTGRPPKDDSKHNQYRIKLNDDELEKLEYCSQKSGKSKAEIIRLGIDKIYQELQLNET
jgi:predicted DNA-binding protein